MQTFEHLSVTNLLNSADVFFCNYFTLLLQTAMERLRDEATP